MTEELRPEDRRRSFQFGYLMFDGQQPGPGWISLGGMPAKRIKSPAEISTGEILLSNLDYEQMYEAGLATNPFLRSSSYLRVRVDTIMNELGLGDEPDDIIETVPAISRVFHRIMNMVPMVGLENQDSAAATLDRELEVIWPSPELPINNAQGHEDVTRHCLQERVRCNTTSVKGGVLISLRIPRMQHARQMLTTPIPVGPWVVQRKPPAMAKGAHPAELPDMYKWLKSLGMPYFAKVDIPDGLGDQSSVVAFSCGARDDSGKLLRRQWASDLEIEEMRKYGKVIIGPALVAKDAVPLEIPAFVSRLFKDGAAISSYSIGVLLENLWMSLVCRRTKPNAKKEAKGLDRFLISYRAAYLRSLDRTICMQKALKLFEKWPVFSYGGGEIKVSVDENDISELVADGFRLGLEPSVGQMMKYGVHLPNDVPWGGPKPFEITARMKAQGRYEYIRAVDEMYFTEGNDRERLIQKLERLAA
jgi:hypothetical protein